MKASKKQPTKARVRISKGKVEMRIAAKPTARSRQIREVKYG